MKPWEEYKSGPWEQYQSESVEKSPEKETPFIQRLAQLVYTPIRGTRALGVGAERLTEGTNVALKSMIPGGAGLITPEDLGQMGKNIPVAKERTAAAFKPGYVPQEGEKLGAFIGETGGLAAATAPLAGIGAGSALAEAGMGAAVGGGITAVQQMSERGQVNPWDVGINAVFGGAVPLTMRGVVAAYPELASRMTKAPKEAFERVLDDPKFFSKYEGTPASIEAAASKPFKALQNLKDNAGKALNSIKEYLNISPTGKEVVSELSQTSGYPRSVSDITNDLTTIKKMSAPKIQKEVSSGIVDESGREIKITKETSGMPRNERLRRLLKLDQDLNESTRGSFNDYTHNLKKQIQDEINQIPGGRRLQKLRQSYGKVLQISEDMGRTLTDPNMSADEVKRMVDSIAKKDVESALGIKHAAELRAIRQLESKTNKSFWNEIKNEVYSSRLQKLTGQYTPKGVIGKAIAITHPGIGAAEFGLSSPAAMAKTGQLIGATSRGARSIPARAIVPTLAPTLRGQEEQQ